MEEVVKEAQQRIGMYGKKTILFVDEIHRFNKGQQDYLLPFVEDGTLVLIGATTENPYFEVNGALISRSIIIELKPLEKEDIEKLLERAVTDPVKGLGTYNVVLDADAKEFLADIAGGDARAALNAIELGVLSTERQADGKIHIDLETASEWNLTPKIKNFKFLHRSASRSASCGTTRRAISITIRSLHLSRACAVLTRMRRSFIWPKCCMPGRISSLSPAAS